MFGTADITMIIIIALLYLLILPFQLIIFPQNYYQIREVIYHKSFRKALKALASRFIFIFVFCLISWLINKQSKVIIYGITLGSILCSWPSVYHYQLFLFWKNKSKAIYFLACIFSVLFSLAAAEVSLKILLPVVFEGKSNYLLDNNGLGFLFMIIRLCIPLGIRKLINHEETENPYMDSETFTADLCLTKRKILFDSQFEYDYLYELMKSAEKHDIGQNLLTTVLQLERINRGSWYHQKMEQFIVHYFPKYAIRKKMTIGMAQISIPWAQEYFQEAPEKYIKKMLEPDTSIDLCACKIRSLIDEYENDFDRGENSEHWDLYNDLNLSDDQEISLYIASQYICGEKISLKKYVMIYMTLLESTQPSNYISNG